MFPSDSVCLQESYLNISLILFDYVNVRHAKSIFNCALMKRNYAWWFIIVFLHKYSPCDAVLCSTGQLVSQNRSNMMVPGGQKTGLDRTDVDTN